MVYSCKMCGAPLNVTDRKSICKCEYCGSAQTLPLSDSEKLQQLFDRANLCRRENEFDRAAAIYDNILTEDPGSSEAHWGLCLCKYGIEYVDDGGRKIPTCHRTLQKSLLDDPDYKAAVASASDEAAELYRREAEFIDELQKDILAVSEREAPYDIFICYKASAADGGRTKESVISREIWQALTDMGYKVFFSEVTLEDKLGVAYEPYIFSALSTAKVMLVVGSSRENMNSVWVKNEWSRFLQMQGKRTLIPCYIDMSPHDLPDEFAMLQAQDLSKLGYLQDLTRGIGKIIPKSGNAVTGGENISAILERGRIFLKNKEYSSVTAQAEKALDLDPHCSEAYWVSFLAENKCSGEGDFGSLADKLAKNLINHDLEPTRDNYISLLGNNCKNALEYSADESRRKYDEWLDGIIAAANAAYEKLSAERKHSEQLRRKKSDRANAARIICPAAAIIAAIIFFFFFPNEYDRINGIYSGNPTPSSLLAGLLLVYWPVGLFTSVIGAVTGINIGLSQSGTAILDRVIWTALNISAAILSIACEYGSDATFSPKIIASFLLVSVLILLWNVPALIIRRISSSITEAVG